MVSALRGWAAVLSVSGVGALGQSVSPDTSVARVGDYVERYYTRAQSIVVDESVTIQPLGLDLRSEGFPRRLIYELRVEWNPDADDDDVPAKVSRQLMSINGRPPKPGQEPECLDPRSTSPEACVPASRPAGEVHLQSGGARTCRWAGGDDDRLSVGEARNAEGRMEDECVTIDLPGRARGRIWADPETAEILRLDEGSSASLTSRSP